MFEDWTKYTIEQLVEKQDQLYVRLNQSAMSGSSGLIDSLMRLIDTIEMEMHSRAALEAVRTAVENSSAIIESDPDLAREHKEKIEKKKEDVQEEPRRRLTSKRSTKPSTT